ncbi:MAG TPA: hypothetical protein VFU69_07905, partial [Ktedonobacterales bacterium]|nr:hypothetical protein [Ktedonobacterales bacterium]
GLLAVSDLGSGCFLDSAQFGLTHEPTPQESIAAGADIVCFSGDKLLGGPQAGIMLGRRDLISQIARHPLMRAIRIDKLTLAGLETTLRHYQRREATERIPIWRMIATSPTALQQRAAQWQAQLRGGGICAELVEGQSTIGGGSLPGETLPTTLLAIPENSVKSQRSQYNAAPEDQPHSPLDALAARLRAGNPPVVARILRDQLLLDPRTVLPEQDDALLAALRAALTAQPLS